MARQTGRVTVKLGADALLSRPGASLQIGGVTREAVPDDQGGVHYRETIAPGRIQCTLIHTSDTDLEALRAARDLEVLYETDTGVTYVLPGAFFVEAGELQNGEVQVTFAGRAAEQV